MIDDEFKSLASDIQQEEIYQLISELNKTQQEMRWTNHPKVFLEVAIVKLCQLETSPISNSQSVDINQLTNKINQLENEIRELKKHGVAVREEVQATTVQKKPASHIKRFPSSSRENK